MFRQEASDPPGTVRVQELQMLQVGPWTALGLPCLACWAPFGLVQVDSRCNLAGNSSKNMQNVAEIAEICRKSAKLMIPEAAEPPKSMVLRRQSHDFCKLDFSRLICRKCSFRAILRFKMLLKPTLGAAWAPFWLAWGLLGRSFVSQGAPFEALGAVLGCLWSCQTRLWEPSGTRWPSKVDPSRP